MQQLKVEHKNTIKNRREGKGRVLAISRRIYRLQNTDVFYVESESSDNTYYFVKYQPSVLEWCSCRDNSTRGLKCKHIFALEFALKKGLVKDTNRLPADAKRDTSVLVSPPKAEQIATVSAPSRSRIPIKSYTEDDYSF